VKAAILGEEGEYSVNIVSGRADFSPPSGVPRAAGLDYPDGGIAGAPP
jgi:hypothetical protein